MSRMPSNQIHGIVFPGRGLGRVKEERWRQYVCWTFYICSNREYCI